MEEDASYLSDPKFKQFTTAVDKALKNFEYSSEWADLISCLGKLNKVSPVNIYNYWKESVQGCQNCEVNG